jgi:hypothetical protein
MNLLADAKEYTDDKRLAGFIILAVSVTVLAILPLYLYFSPPDFLIRARPVAALWGLGGIIFLVTLAFFLQNRGMLFKLPLKVYDEALLIQPVFSLGPKRVPYEDISSLEIWYGEGYRRARSGCSVLSGKLGSITSVENFHGKEGLRSFVERIRPMLEQKGLRMKVPYEEAGSLEYVFHRPMVRFG